METSDHDAGVRKALRGWQALLLRYRRLVVFVTHQVLFTLALLGAFLIRSDALAGERGYSWMKGLQSFLIVLPFFLILKTVIFWRMKLFRGGWQYSSIRDVMRILLACWLFVFIAFVLVYGLYRIPTAVGLRPPWWLVLFFGSMPRGVLVLDFLATVFLICTARLAIRIYREQLRPTAAEGVQRVMIVGAGNAAEVLIREILRMRVERYRVVGMVDDDPHKQKLMMHDIPVLGTTEDIRRLCDELNVGEILIAAPSATQKQMRRIVELCQGTKLKFQALPSVSDLIDRRVTVSQIRPVDINDLLGRDAVELDVEAVARFLHGRCVLITGAGGSIGSEMCRQVCEFGPRQLIFVEQAETPLFDIQNELLKKHPEVPQLPRICDIYDRDRVMTIWEETRPDVVIHAAAHKHVPLMEWNPCEAIKNNILGSKNVADASCRFGVAEFVTISTDKAVNPSSVMGCSKRVAEIYTQSLNGRDGCVTQFKAVRFGNVLGSAGSVVPTFRRQIAAGGPVTVTHPEMTRYFMTIPEAAQLVLEAAATGAGGQIFLLDMGEPVKIADLARQMIVLSGFRPGADIDITYTGIRPGEKLFEELKIDGEDIAPTVHPKVMVWKHQPVPWDAVTVAMDELASLANCTARDPIIDALRRAVPEYEPQNPPKNGA